MDEPESIQRLTYRIREIDGPKHSDILAKLHQRTFGDSAEQPDVSRGHWWLVYYEKEPIAFAGLTPSQLGFNCGYLKRVGVLPAHRGNGLQRRLVRVREARARRNGWKRVITDTTENVPSANSLIRAGYRMFRPTHGWAFNDTLYWTKTL